MGLNMKLYTEEQVKLMIEKSRETGLTAEFLTLTTPPIELPSDEEIEAENLNEGQNPQLNIDSFSGWVRCSECKHLRHEVRLGNPNGDIVECTQDSNENTFINDMNIYEEWHCDVFEPCR